METLTLVPHPDHPPLDLSGMTASIIGIDAYWLRLRWRIEGAGKLVVPPFAGNGRADGLWKTTCFELFVTDPTGPGYSEVNLSPSERWAVYNFTGYRQGMSDAPVDRRIDCTLRRGSGVTIFDAAIPIFCLPIMPWDVGLCAVIEEHGGVKSYWALAHPPKSHNGGKPDFHHPACFAASVAAPHCP